MIPPTSIDGTDITGATIDGTDVTEITVDGQTVFTAQQTPPSTILNLKASDYSGSTWTANIGPDFTDFAGDPTKIRSSNGGETFDAVEFINAGVQASFSASPPYAIIYVNKINSYNNNFDRLVTGLTVGTFTHAIQSNVGNRYTLDTDVVDVFGGGSVFTFDYTVFTIESRNGTRLLINNSVDISSGSTSSWPGGLTFGIRPDSQQAQNGEFAEITVLENHTQTERDNEINRLRSEYGI